MFIKSIIRARDWPRIWTTTYYLAFAPLQVTFTEKYAFQRKIISLQKKNNISSSTSIMSRKIW